MSSGHQIERLKQDLHHIMESFKINTPNLMKVCSVIKSRYIPHEFNKNNQSKFEQLIQGLKQQINDQKQLVRIDTKNNTSFSIKPQIQVNNHENPLKKSVPSYLKTTDVNFINKSIDESSLSNKTQKQPFKFLQRSQISQKTLDIGKTQKFNSQAMGKTAQFFNPPRQIKIQKEKTQARTTSQFFIKKNQNTSTQSIKDKQKAFIINSVQDHKEILQQGIEEYEDETMSQHPEKQDVYLLKSVYSVPQGLSSVKRHVTVIQIERQRIAKIRTHLQSSQ